MAKLAIDEGKSVEFNLSKNWLNNVDEVAVMKPVLSNPAMHWPLLTGLPFVTLVPKYFTSVNAFKVGSHEPISKGLNSKSGIQVYHGGTWVSTICNSNW